MDVEEVDDESNLSNLITNTVKSSLYSPFSFNSDLKGTHPLKKSTTHSVNKPESSKILKATQPKKKDSTKTRIENMFNFDNKFT